MKAAITGRRLIQHSLLAAFLTGTFATPWLGEDSVAQAQDSWQTLPDMPVGKWEAGTIRNGR